MDSSARNVMKLSLVEVPNVVGVLSWAKKVLLAHILANKTETELKVKYESLFLAGDWSDPGGDVVCGREG